MEILATNSEKARSTYTLDHNELADAICILRGEIAALAPLTSTQRQILPYLSKLTYAAFLILAAIGITLNHSLISGTRALVTAIFAYGAYGVASVYFGWNEMRALRKLRQVEGRLGLARTEYFSLAGWKDAITHSPESDLRLARPRHSYFAGLSKTIARLPILFATALTLVLVAVLFAWYVVHGAASWLVDIDLVLIGLVLAKTTRNIMFRNSLLPLDRLHVAEHLRDRLLEQLNSSAAGEEQTFSIPEAEYKHIARMERALINLDRQRAIKQSARKSQRSLLPVQQSPEVFFKKSRLDPEARLSVQAQIEDLSTNPQPPTAYESGDGTWRLPVQHSSLEIKYVLDVGLKEIKVNDLIDSSKISSLTEKSNG